MVGAGTACLAVTGTAGLGLLGRASKVWPLPEAPPTNAEGPWAFRSRPDLRPPAVEVVKEAHDTAPGYIFVAPQEEDTGQGGSLAVDDGGQVVWFRRLPEASGRAMNFGVQKYRGEPVLT
jgi:hypothetical protein